MVNNMHEEVQVNALMKQLVGYAETECLVSKTNLETKITLSKIFAENSKSITRKFILAS